MERNEYRVIIKYFVMKGKGAKEIFDDMSETLGKECPSYTTVKFWAAEFKRGRKSVSDDPRSGQPKLVTTQTTVDAVHDLVMDDRRVTIRHIATTLSIATTTVHKILHDELNMSKLSARWVPRMLTPTHKRMRRDISAENLELMQADREEFIGRVVTQDETWVHHFDPETKVQSKQWKRPGSPPPPKFKKITSAKKIMASVFWDKDGVIMIDYLERGHTITGKYYAQELQRLREALVRKRRGKLRSGVLLLQDNAPSHTSHVAMAAARQCGFELLNHPPYSPDLAPSDFYLFPKLKSVLRGRVYDTDSDVIDAVNEFLTGQDSSFYYDGIAKLEERWEKCVRARGDYIEK